ncbi:MAG: hypothetical protein JWQ09_4398 [Segetibacter sp.]|nr:hypothetical protein [Segetibacter sp.]
MFHPRDKVMIADQFCKDVYEIESVFHFWSKGSKSQPYVMLTNGNYCLVANLVSDHQKFMSAVVESYHKIMDKEQFIQIDSNVKTPGLTKSQIINVLKESDKALTIYEIQERLPMNTDLEIHTIYTSCWRMVKENKLVKTKTMGHFRAFYSVKELK